MVASLTVFLHLQPPSLLSITIMPASNKNSILMQQMCRKLWSIGSWLALLFTVISLGSILVFDHCNNFPLGTLISLPWCWSLKESDTYRWVGKHWENIDLKVEKIRFSWHVLKICYIKWLFTAQSKFLGLKFSVLNQAQCPYNHDFMCFSISNIFTVT